MKLYKTTHTRSACNHAGRSEKLVSRWGGQAVVEMALVSVILIVLSMGIIQYGMLYNTTLQLTNAAREGARFAGIHGKEDDVESKTRDYIRDKVITSTSITKAALPANKIQVTMASNAGKGDPISVEITYDMTRKFFLPVGVLGLDTKDKRWLEHKTTATMIIE